MDLTHRRDWRRVGSRAAPKIRQREGAVMASSSLQSLVVRHLQFKKKTARAVDFKFSGLDLFSGLLLRFESASPLQIGSSPFCFPFSISGGRLYDQGGIAGC